MRTHTVDWDAVCVSSDALLIVGATVAVVAIMTLAWWWAGRG